MKDREGKADNLGIGEEIEEKWANIGELLRSAKIEKKYSPLHWRLIERTGNYCRRILGMEASPDCFIDFGFRYAANEI